MLDVSYFDMEFTLKSKQGVGLNKPVSLKTITFSLVATFLWFFVVFKTFLKSGGLFVLVGFTIAWIILSVLLVRTDKTKRTGLELVLTAINYISKANRQVFVRSSDSVYALQRLSGVANVDPEDGLVHFVDGKIGHVYHVVGTASNLMFEEDKNAILDKVDSFYKKMPVNVEIIYDTIYEGHKVDEQVQAVIDDANNLKIDSKGLRVLLKERHDILAYVIHNNDGLTSLHQYLIVRASSESALQEFENLIIGDVEHGGLMFRLVKTLNYEEVVDYFKSVLSPLEKRTFSKSKRMFGSPTKTKVETKPSATRPRPTTKRQSTRQQVTPTRQRGTRKTS